MITWEKDADGIVTLTMDDPDQGANTMNKTFQDSLAETTQRLVAERDSITGVILTSGKKTFFAGGDLGLLSKATKDDAPFAMLSAGSAWPAMLAGIVGFAVAVFGLYAWTRSRAQKV